MSVALPFQAQWLYTNLNRYNGYDRRLVDNFGAMGFQVPDIVRIFAEVGISQRSHQLDDGQVDDICARLLAGV